MRDGSAGCDHAVDHAKCVQSLARRSARPWRAVRTPPGRAHACRASAWRRRRGSGRRGRRPSRTSRPRPRPACRRPARARTRRRQQRPRPRRSPGTRSRESRAPRRASSRPTPSAPDGSLLRFSSRRLRLPPAQKWAAVACDHDRAHARVTANSFELGDAARRRCRGEARCARPGSRCAGSPPHRGARAAVARPRLSPRAGATSRARHGVAARGRHDSAGRRWCRAAFAASGTRAPDPARRPSRADPAGIPARA